MQKREKIDLLDQKQKYIFNIYLRYEYSVMRYNGTW